MRESVASILLMVAFLCFVFWCLVGCAVDVGCRHISDPGPPECRDYMNRHWQLHGAEMRQ